jgi:17 kDa common-antigen outer membrane protein
MHTAFGVEHRGAGNRAARQKAATRRQHPVILGVLAGLLLAGCTNLEMSGQATPAAAVTAPVPADPFLAFAASAAPGSETTVVSAQTGRAMRVRMLRAYSAASGRECREVLIGSGLDERSRLVCQNDGGWVEARPLLRSGGTARP